MPYPLNGPKLRVVRKLSLEEHAKPLLSKTRLLVIEHILPTTEDFLKLLCEAGAEVHSLIAKPYSIDPAVEERLTNSGIAPITKITNYDELEHSTIISDLLNDAEEKSTADNKDIIVIDVGGYFSETLKTWKDPANSHVRGIIEDTTFGHNRYLKSYKDISYPIFSVARSALKQIEARFVGNDAVSAMDLILRKHGVTLTGGNALVIGYGMIGQNVARALAANDLQVSVYDKRDHKNLSAFIDGFHVSKKLQLLKSADVIYCATGDPDGALSYDEIHDCCHNNAILASVGSRDTEFALSDLKTMKIAEPESIDSDGHLVRFQLPSNKHVVVANNGTAINFLMHSIPVEILDLVFSEILTGVLAILKEPDQFPSKKEVYEYSPLDDISKLWLRSTNR